MDVDNGPMPLLLMPNNYFGNKCKANSGMGANSPVIFSLSMFVGALQNQKRKIKAKEGLASYYYIYFKLFVFRTEWKNIGAAKNGAEFSLFLYAVFI